MDSLGNLPLLEAWYRAQSNGSWEQRYGIRIDSLEVPGWLLRIDLDETPAELCTLPRTMVERGANDWFEYWVERREFQARTSPGNLGEAIRIFVEWFASVERARSVAAVAGK